MVVPLWRASIGKKIPFACLPLMPSFWKKGIPPFQSVHTHARQGQVAASYSLLHVIVHCLSLPALCAQKQQVKLPVCSMNILAFFFFSCLAVPTAASKQCVVGCLLELLDTRVPCIPSVFADTLHSACCCNTDVG